MRPLGPAAGLAARQATARLQTAGVASARHDAEALARFVAGDASDPERFDADRYDALVARRVTREPLQHLVGTAPFRYLELAVGPGVFIPRPETEGLVELAAPACRPGAVVVDLCAGSGAIALAVATEHPGVVVHAVEVSAAALPWLRRNVDAAGCVPPVVVHHCEVAATPGLVADVVVSNPPYLPDGLVVEPEVAADPATALWGGPDGLVVLRQVVATAARLLRPGGLLALEHDASHQPAVLECLRRNGFCDVRGRQDLAGRDRYALGRAAGARMSL